MKPSGAHPRGPSFRPQAWDIENASETNLRAWLQIARDADEEHESATEDLEALSPATETAAPEAAAPEAAAAGCRQAKRQRLAARPCNELTRADEDAQHRSADPARVDSAKRVREHTLSSVSHSPSAEGLGSRAATLDIVGPVFFQTLANTATRDPLPRSPVLAPRIRQSFKIRVRCLCFMQLDVELVIYWRSRLPTSAEILKEPWSGGCCSLSLE